MWASPKTIFSTVTHGCNPSINWFPQNHLFSDISFAWKRSFKVTTTKDKVLDYQSCLQPQTTCPLQGGVLLRKEVSRWPKNVSGHCNLNYLFFASMQEGILLGKLVSRWPPQKIRFCTINHACSPKPRPLPSCKIEFCLEREFQGDHHKDNFLDYESYL